MFFRLLMEHHNRKFKSNLQSSKRQKNNNDNNPKRLSCQQEAIVFQSMTTPSSFSIGIIERTVE